MGYELSKPMLRAELEADLKRFVNSTYKLYSCISILSHDIIRKS